MVLVGRGPGGERLGMGVSSLALMPSSLPIFSLLSRNTIYLLYTLNYLSLTVDVLRFQIFTPLK